ncbi:unnamed protein product [Mytilus edulis]|uniref:B box-type domain-containing protein n=1 Tax=Mytilus edulis TaxID=6550 RepID=A0A8S3SIR9_MYTED|nr:unnamed protein product [Mytilus edulis]
MAEPLTNCEHPIEILNLFCCKCEEVICVHCMIDSHQKHEMKHLFDARKVIQGQLSRILTTDHENITGKIKEVNDFVSKELSDSDTDEKQICKRIEQLAESEKNKIERHTKDLKILGNNESSNIPPECISPGLCSDLNIESLNKNQTNASGTPDEYSSDEVRTEYPLTIELSSSVKNCVSKIIPITDDEAWIIGDNKLFKLRGNKLEETLYIERVDDMTMLADGGVLLLNRQTSYIRSSFMSCSFTCWSCVCLTRFLAFLYKTAHTRTVR